MKKQSRISLFILTSGLLTFGGLFFAACSNAAGGGGGDDSGSDSTSTPTTYTTGVTGQISASDAPTGYAGVNWASSASKEVTVSTKSDLVKYANQGGYIIYVSGMIDMSEGMLPTTGGGTTDELDAFVKTKTTSLNSSSSSTYPKVYNTYSDYKADYVKVCSKTTDDKSSSSTATTVSQTMWKLNSAYGSEIKITLKSNTTIIGLGSSSGIKGGTISVNGVSNVVIRNLTIQDAYDPFPHHEKNDGYNAQWDAITIQGSCSNIWIDHCTFLDSMNIYTVSTGDSTNELYQTYDGTCDIKGDGKYVTVSYCKFYNHDKTMLIGSSDDEGLASTRQITLHHNYFLNCEQRLPMVRNTTIHIYNNYYEDDGTGFYDQSYAVGVRKGSIVYGENNYFGSGIQYSYSGDSTTSKNGTFYSSGDSDNSKNGVYKPRVSSFGENLFSDDVKAYSYTPETATDAKATVISNAGAGVWSVSR